MALNDDELKYKNVISTLKNLPEVNAPSNFEADLMRRINSGNYEIEKQSFWKKIFLPARLIPSAALAVGAVILLFFLNINSDENENPLLADPKIRQDIIQTEDFSNVDLNSQTEKKSSKDLKIQGYKNQVPDSGFRDNYDELSFSNADFSINKSGLNFRQVNLTEEEQHRLNELKEHFKTLLKNSKNN